MLRVNIFLLFLIVYCNVHSSIRDIEAKIKMRGDDSVYNCFLEVVTFKKDKNEINPLKLHGTFKIIEGASEVVVSEENIEVLKFTDFKNRERLFMNDRILNFNQSRGILLEVMYLGKLSWFVEYQKSKKVQNIIAGQVLGGIIGAAIANHLSEDAIVSWVKKGKQHEKKIELLNKSAFSSLMSDRPDLHGRLESFKTEEELIGILESYDSNEESIYKKQRKKDTTDHYSNLYALSQKDSLEFIKAENTGQLRIQEYVLYKAKSGDIFGMVVSKKGNGFIEFQYYPEKNNPRKYTVPIKDIQKIKSY